MLRCSAGSSCRSAVLTFKGGDSGLVGEEESQIWLGQRRFDLVVRLRDDRRDSFEAIRRLLIDGHDGSKIPLGQLAEVTQTFGPAAIRREAGTRRIAVESSVSGRDLGSTAAEVAGS
jgi:heavy metal efflux system protein